MKIVSGPVRAQERVQLQQGMKDYAKENLKKENHSHYPSVCHCFSDRRMGNVLCENV